MLVPREGVVVLELYSGCGQHGDIVASQLRENLWLPPHGTSRHRARKCAKAPSDPRGTAGMTRAIVTLITVDSNPSSNATLTFDARGLSDSNLALLRSKIPNKIVVLLSSPPCTAYSVANTTGYRDLVGADELVEVVKRVHYGLACECTVVENPGTGLLVHRDVINNFLPNQSMVNYCSHGSAYFWKLTCLWSGGFKLEDYGFAPRLCGGRGKCPIMFFDRDTRKWVHPPWTGTSLRTRQSIPGGLSREIGIAVCNFLNTLN